MKALLLLAAALAAAPCAAQVSVPEGLGQAVAAGKAMGARKKADAAKAAKTFDALTARLIKEGSAVRVPQGLLHAFQSSEPKADGVREVTVGVLEVPGPKSEGVLSDPSQGKGGPVFRDLVERHTYEGVQAQVMTVRVSADGKARLDSRIYVLDMAGTVRAASVQTNDEGGVSGSEIKFDDAKTKTRAMEPGEAKAGWDALLPETAKMGKIVEI